MPLYRKILIVLGLLAVLFWAFSTGKQAISNEKRLTIDGGIYNHLGAQLSRDLTNYSPQTYWDQRKDILPEGSARDIARGYLDQPIFKHPPILAYLIAASKTIFGDTNDAARYVPLFLRLATIIVVFIIALKIMGPLYGLLASFFAAIDPIYTLSSQKVWTEVPYSFFVYAGICFLICGGKKKYTYASAVSMGIAMLCKYVAFLGVLPAYLHMIFERQKKRVIAGYSLIILVVFSPWLYWNYRVFGSGFLGRMLKLHSSEISGVTLSFNIIPIILLVSLLMIAVFLYFLGLDRRAGLVPDNWKRIWNSETAKIVSTIMVTQMILMFFLISRGPIFRGLSIFHLPVTSARMHFYDYEPWHFYLSHIMQLSPIFIFSYLGIVFFREWDHELICIALIPVFVFLLFSYYRRFETRYITMATPAMMILAAYAIKKFNSLIKQMASGSRKILAFSLSAAVVYTVARTLYVNIMVVIKNDFIFF